jgi:DnaJ-class molecular chaperone
MTARQPRELGTFARRIGFEPSACHACTGTGIDPSARSCTNCGGTGRLWTSQRGSLSDEGLARLRRLVEEC